MNANRHLLQGVCGLSRCSVAKKPPRKKLTRGVKNRELATKLVWSLFGVLETVKTYGSNVIPKRAALELVVDKSLFRSKPPGSGAGRGQ